MINTMLTVESIKKPPESSFCGQHTGSTTDRNASSLTVNSNTNASFLSYRDPKVELKRINEANKLKRKTYRSNPERMWNLRLKFVEQCKKYLGIPYGQKYFTRDMPEYHSHLFLDCCGLVRRAMRDLQNDFGFRIGGGNQAYQFDTLPGEIKNLEDVKPGDLVFISGVYNTPRLKIQPHNITHVEVMLGDGTERTIGSRWNNGKVSIFDSYKFISKSFHSERYFIKSIDPWLWGYCRSYCGKHAWPYNTHMPKQKSSLYSQCESEYRARIKLERKSALDYLKENSTNNKSHKRKTKRRKKKIKKPVIKSTKNAQKPINKTSGSSNSQMQLQLNKNISNTNADERMTEYKSEYEFCSESEFDSEADQDCEADEISCECEDQGAEEEGEEIEGLEEDCASDEERHAGSNCANHDSEYSLSSLSDTFFYENFPSKSRVDSCKHTAYDGEYDDDNDVEYSDLSFKLLQLSEKEASPTEAAKLE